MAAVAVVLLFGIRATTCSFKTLVRFRFGSSLLNIVCLLFVHAVCGTMKTAVAPGAQTCRPGDAGPVRVSMDSGPHRPIFILTPLDLSAESGSAGDSVVYVLTRILARRGSAFGRLVPCPAGALERTQGSF